MKDNKDSFVELLIGYRGRAGFTQQDLANKIGVHPGQSHLNRE